MGMIRLAGDPPQVGSIRLSRVPAACTVKPGRMLLSALCALILFCGAARAAGAGNDANASPSLRLGVVKLPVIDKQDIRFVRVSADEESFQSGIITIAQDNYGFMWLGNHGLHRYDGYSLKSYWHEPGNPNSLSEDGVSVVFKDRAGILWIGTVSGGLDRLDPVHDTFTHYRHYTGDARSLSSNRVTCLYQDRGGELWIGTKGGLDRLDPATGTFIHYRHDPQDAGSLGTNEITATLEDHLGNLWVGTAQGLNKLDRSTGRFSSFLPDPADPQSLGHNYVTCIREDHSGVLWTTIGSWLSSLDVKTGKFTHYSFHSEEPGSQSVAFATSIYEDRDGALWLGTVDSGLLKLDRERKNFIRYTREPGNPNSLPGNQVATLFEDAEGELWAGTVAGLCRFLIKPPPFVNYQHEARSSQSLPDNPISSVLADSKGFLWIAGAGRLSRLDRTTGQFTFYQHDSRDPYSLPPYPVFGLREDRSGTLWLGSYGGGLNRFNRKTGQVFAYRHEPKLQGSLSSDLVLCLFEDRQGTLWIGTQSGGLNRFDPITGRFTSWRNDPNNPDSLSHNNVISIVEDRAGFLWLGTLDGLNRFDPGTEKFLVYRHNSEDPRSLSHNKVNAVWEDLHGTLWVGTDNGLNQLDQSHGNFTTFTKENGLPDNKINAIQEDDQGYLWLATPNGLSRFQPQTETFRNYSESDGLPASSVSAGSSRTSRGELIFGSTNGVITFYPNRLSTNPYVPHVVMTGFSLFNRPVQVGAQSPLRQPIWATDSLTLTHKQTIFTLEFAALSYVAPEKNRYRYRLEELESEWNEVDSKRRLATYTSLPAGKYVFRVQGSNNDQIWDEKGVTLAITVLPPWWATWWFRSIAGLSIVGLTFGAYRSHVRRLQLGAARLEAQVAERTSELLVRTGELLVRTRELQIAKDAAEAANRAKSAFLANMSHELRTPLNAILGFSTLLREGGATPEEQGKDLDIINRSGEHLLHLINDVLDVAKIEAGRTVVENAVCDVQSLVRDLTEMMQMRAKAKNLQLLVDQSSGFPRLVRTDAPKLRQILINLIGNAVKYTERGAVKLRLDSLPEDSSGRVLLKFEVEDTGIGIAAKDHERIFEPFVRAGRMGSQDGTGLGLAIVRTYVELMGGTIRLQSVPGFGSRFYVELPVEPEAETEAAAPTDNRARVVGIEPGQPEYRVLIVEDQFENRLLLRRLLEGVGFRVRLAESGEEGIRIFETWRPQFIWMDRGLRGIDGIETVRRIREMDGGREVKIAAVTASALAGERDEMLASGLDDFLSKPYRLGEIFDCMARHLDVRYVRAQDAPQRPVLATPVLRPDALATLPEELRKELADAVIALDGERITGLIRRISEADLALGETLAVLAGRFAYTPILKALRSTNGKPAIGAL